MVIQKMKLNQKKLQEKEPGERKVVLEANLPPRAGSSIE